jgi:hypothetical protein
VIPNEEIFGFGPFGDANAEVEHPILFRFSSSMCYFVFCLASSTVIFREIHWMEAFLSLVTNHDLPWDESGAHYESLLMNDRLITGHVRNGYFMVRQ